MTDAGVYGRVPVDDALTLLCAMQNLGITREDNASSVESLSSKTGLSLHRVQSALTSLLADGFVDERRDEGRRAYYVTTRGILTAMSMFS